MKSEGYKETNIGLIPEDWKLLEADEIKDKGKSIITGPFGSNISRKYFVDSGIPVIRGNNLTTDMERFKDDGFVYVTLEKANELNTYAIRNDIVFTAAGTLGQVGIIENQSKYDKYVISNKQLRLRTNQDIIIPLFAFYWFSNPWMTKYIEQHNTGSTIPLINLSVLRKLPIPVPPIEEQREIVTILDSLDQKIQLNKQTNQTLEQIGQAIFRHWFVHFEFPDSKGRPYKSSGGEMEDSELGEIPKGWEVGKLGDLISITSGKRPKEKSEIQTIDFKIPLIGASSLMGYVKETLYNKPILVIGRVGTHGIVQKIIPPSYPSDNTLVIIPKFYEFVYQILTRIDYNSLNVGTTQPLITQKSIKNQEIVIPSHHILLKHENIISSLSSKIIHNNSENEYLSKIRDSLLPKLMSGKIRVSIPEEATVK